MFLGNVGLYLQAYTAHCGVATQNTDTDKDEGI
jgi:hypothetical protein